jgi:putative transposase
MWGGMWPLVLSKTSKRQRGRELYFFHNPVLPMLISLTRLLTTLASIFRSRADLQLENLALRHQIGVLLRSARKRPKLTPLDRLLWVGLSRIWSDWRSALAIVNPETVVAWHRASFRLLWSWKVRRGNPGRPVVAREVRDLIRRMCRENPGWGCASHPRRVAQTRHRYRRDQH